MDAIASILRTGMEGILTPFDWLGPFWGLTLLSILTGVGMLWVVGKTTPQKLVERSRNKMDSAVYEIRLFLDSPKRVALSLGRLLGNSVLYIAYMLPAFVLLALPLGIMFLGLEARHGFKPLPLDKPVVVSVELAPDVDGKTLAVNTPEGVEITAPPLYVRSTQTVYLRTEIHQPGTHSLYFDVGGRAVEKLLVSDPEATQMAPDRASGMDLFLAYGPEGGLDGPITGIHVKHPANEDNRYLGLSMPWWVWWLVLMMVAAFGLRKPMGVTL